MDISWEIQAAAHRPLSEILIFAWAIVQNGHTRRLPLRRQFFCIFGKLQRIDELL